MGPHISAKVEKWKSHGLCSQCSAIPHSFRNTICVRQANDLVAERGAAVAALETQLAAAVERADAAEDGLEEARLDIAELKRVNDVQVTVTSVLRRHETMLMPEIESHHSMSCPRLDADIGCAGTSVSRHGVYAISAQLATVASPDPQPLPSLTSSHTYTLNTQLAPSSCSEPAPCLEKSFEALPCPWQGKALKSARSELEQATQQKVAALLQLSDAQMSGGRAEDRAERAGRLVDTLRAQLDQVTSPP